MKILVMGGTEFVSNSLTKYLISKGYTEDIFTRGINCKNWVCPSIHIFSNKTL